MPAGARAIFDDVYGGLDPAAEGAQNAWIATPSGRREIVVDPANSRIKAYGLLVDDVDAPPVSSLVAGLGADDLPYTKLTVYALPGDDMDWITRGFLGEGFIRGFFPDGIDARIWARYADDGRDEAPRDGEHDRIAAHACTKEPRTPAPPDDLDCRPAREDDAAEVSALLRATFPEYPTPLDEATIATAIREETSRFRLLVDADGGLAAVASAEIDHKRGSAEMTDCATRPDRRGGGLMSYLLWRLELDVAELDGIRDLYTLARADEPGMNCAFAKLGYDYTGRLVNNCRMPNGWESMNIWCRRSEPTPGLDSPTRP